MILRAYAAFLVLLNFWCYFAFGMLFSSFFRKKRISPCRTVLAGFFLYYTVFSLLCIPMMIHWKPLSALAGIWGAVLSFVSAAAAVLIFVRLRKKEGIFPDYGKEDLLTLIPVLIITLLQAVLIIRNYQFTLDAAYYVANAATSLQTDMMNVYDPYTGEWQDHFQVRYFFATFTMNDAVMCRLFSVHPLIWCKTVMAGTSVALTDMVLFMTGRKLFSKDRAKVLCFFLFCAVMNFCFITIFTSSNFLVTRTYEGKCLLGNVVLPAVFYLYLKLLENVKSREDWFLLAFMGLGSAALSSSANMLYPAAVAVTILPLSVIRKDKTVVWKAAGCMLPGIVLMLAYVAYVKGMFVFYTYPK